MRQIDCLVVGLGLGLGSVLDLVFDSYEYLQENSLTNHLAANQVPDWSTRRLKICRPTQCTSHIELLHYICSIMYTKPKPDPNPNPISY